MDPNAALETMRDALRRYNAEDDEGYDRFVAATEAAEAAEALDGWLSKGGFLPSAWSGERTVWTLTVDSDAVATTVHATEAEAIATLRANYFATDFDAPESDDELVEFATNEGGLVLYIEEHPIPTKEK